MRRCRLGRVVCGLLLRTVDDGSRHGGYDEDLSLYLVVDPPLSSRTCEQERASEVDIYHPFEVFEGVFFCRGATSDACVGDEDIDGAEVLDDLIPGTLYAFLGRRITLVAVDFGFG
jgi:hypothetical protein